MTARSKTSRLGLALSALLLAGALTVSADAAPGGGGGHGGGHGGGGHGGHGGGGGRFGDGGRGGGFRGGDYGRNGWGGGYYGGPPLVYGNPYYCTPALVWEFEGGYDQCD